eukprot:CAMPEP_0204551894 /NCGR_PEP_ID=MMETSP0661-20131031/26234_1 /ASSEMBLY_ACC=CAM_ASM_000606 /TAXON_ID=109239 /ORGANISM="Alexandrium margalefi, Strain AMGDE01CS-322" /LENGTH=61 /DNA_ID=CAMNT_0051558889 /DNA_START=321 /DNA_END=502 /DNA_ORIENTATION=-
MSKSGQSFISGNNRPVKLGYLRQSLRTRSSSSRGKAFPEASSPEFELPPLLDRPAPGGPLS